ncbi:MULTISPECIES: hypothetical protein [Pseudanabaena]|uniref:hypothetical protein n=1 Tax=Pseudanabaena TaxID=1152 RepID=UPI00247A7639|nr:MULTISPECIES: hypothetical protein [Pseudanabaena]MEA5486563.1 hypothetical protein [Pseudanabaena sp. CCNP1317]WGS71400.1 hypothetical protein OA858_17020 [Pseudanabaena galeata CCNP1313]
MATVSILPISDPKGEKSYRALAGDKHSEGKTAGQALDALTAQLGEIEFSAIVLIQSFQPDSLFGAEQQKHLSELMDLWRLARDQDQELSINQQQELDQLVEAELRAATARTSILIQS